MHSDVTEDYRHKGLFSRMKDRLWPPDEYDEEYEEEDSAPDARRQSVTLRLQSPKVTYVSIKQPQTYEDARQAADGLKEHRQQIINLEKATPEMAEKIIDFLNGVTYALNGFVEKVGDRIYLFAPSNVVIDAPTEMHKSTSGFFDKNP